MAKTNKQAIMKLCADINKKNGDGTVYSLGSSHANLNIPRWSTGIEDLDNILGGGMPEGRTIEIFGAEGSGKTTLVYHLCAMHDLCIDFPIEGTFDAARAKVFGNRPKQMLVGRSAYGEDTCNKMIQFARCGIPLICVDSVSSLLPRDDVEKVIKSANKDTIEEQRIGGTARLLNKYLPPLEDIIAMSGTTIIFVNQLRDNVQAVMFGEQTKTSGGRRLKHSCSVRLQVARKAWLKIPNYNPCNTAKEEAIGFIMKCKVVKSKVCDPLGECEIPCIFDRGFVSFDEIAGIREELKAQRKEKYKGRKKKIEDYEEE